MKKIFWFLFLQLATFQVFSQSFIYQIANCDGEDRTVLFANQISDIIYAAKGDITFKTSRSLKFSPESKANLDSLDITAISFRKVFPKNYWNQNVPVIRLDTKPNEEGRIWFENVFVENIEGNIKVIAALKVVFAGTSAEQERMNPKIQDIIITTDLKALKKYIAVIQQLKKANNVQMSPPMKEDNSAPPPPIRN